MKASSVVAIEVENVSKRFRIFHAKHQSVKERVLRAGRSTYNDFWALDDVSFQVREGETVGIVGRNGSGKSTLLKCVSGVLKPTKGRVLVRGQLAALLELGAGFQPELSGRDNIYLNGSLLGLSRKEMDKRFDEIVSFAELEHFIDTQVKFYSSGMYIRLGFAVAVNVDPDILVVDEVLAVGDEAFQRKCLARIKAFQNEGRTILFVTHASDLVRQICDRAVVLSDGRIIAEGPASEAVHVYQERLTDSGVSADQPAVTGLPNPTIGFRKAICVSSVEVDHPGAATRPYLLTGEPMTVTVGLDANESVDNVAVAVEVHDHEGQLIYGSDTSIVDQPFSVAIGHREVRLVFDRVPLLDGTYTLSTSVCDGDGQVYDIAPEQNFEVLNPGRSRGNVDLDLRAEVARAS
jgi:ABC-2 type transport system ATP-binding protein